MKGKDMNLTKLTICSIMMVSLSSCNWLHLSRGPSSVGAVAGVSNPDFHALIARPENYVGKEVELTRHIIGPDFTGNRLTLKIADDSGIETSIDLVILKDSPFYDKLTVASPVKNFDIVHAKGTFRAYSNGQRYYFQPDMAEVVKQ